MSKLHLQRKYNRHGKKRHLDKKLPILEPIKKVYLNRIIDSVPYPETRRLTAQELFASRTKKLNTSKLIEHFKKEGRLQESTAIAIIEACREILKEEPTLLELKGPITVCGDIHGQFFDMIRIFNMNGYPPFTTYVFLGDYVDRGPYGIEVILTMFSMKINYPDKIFLLRGNHECRHITRRATFRRECLMKYSEELYLTVMEAFDCLPLTAVIDEKFICMHGGISPDVYTLSDIKNINRFCEIPHSGPMCDLLWSDPAPDYDSATYAPYFTPNIARNISYYFSYDACCGFLNRNDLSSVIRAHEMQMNGFRMFKENRQTLTPSVVSVFSAPKYLDLISNKGAILLIDKHVTVKQFMEAPRPYCLPYCIDVFTWSLPFIHERFVEILRALLKFCRDDESLYDENLREDEIRVRNEIIRERLLQLGEGNKNQDDRVRTRMQ